MLMKTVGVSNLAGLFDTRPLHRPVTVNGLYYDNVQLLSQRFIRQVCGARQCMPRHKMFGVTREQIHNGHVRCSCTLLLVVVGSCCYQTFKVLRLLHFTTHRR